MAMDGPLKVVRKLSKLPVTVLAWTAASASCTLSFLKPIQNIPPWGVEEEALRTGRDVADVAEEVRNVSLLCDLP